MRVWTVTDSPIPTWVPGEVKSGKGSGLFGSAVGSGSGSGSGSALGSGSGSDSAGGVGASAEGLALLVILASPSISVFPEQPLKAVKETRRTAAAARKARLGGFITRAFYLSFGGEFAAARRL